MIEKIEQKKFFRVLKEFGLYTQWVKNRKKCIGEEPIKSIIPIRANGNFGHDISSSFIFSECAYTDMWYAFSGACYCTKYDEILNSQNEIDYLKSLIEKNIDKK